MPIVFFRFSPMIRILAALSLCGFSSLSIAAAMEVRGLSCEHIPEPMGIETSAPRFSWKLDSSENGQAQTAWQILVAGSPNLLAADKGDVWDSGWQEGSGLSLDPLRGSAAGLVAKLLVESPGQGPLGRGFAMEFTRQLCHGIARWQGARR
jgi:hypothetical protein